MGLGLTQVDEEQGFRRFTGHIVPLPYGRGSVNPAGAFNGGA
jgi:hypothetical protein